MRRSETKLRGCLERNFSETNPRFTDRIDKIKDKRNEFTESKRDPNEKRVVQRQENLKMVNFPFV